MERLREALVTMHRRFCVLPARGAALILLALFLGGAIPALGMDSADSAAVRTLVDQSRGKVVLLNFWASWCAPCKKEMPDLMELRRAFSDKDLAMIGISMDFDIKAAEDYAASAKLNFPQFYGKPEVMDAFKVAAIPKTMVWDRRGRLAYEHVGPVDPRELTETVERLATQ